MAEFWGFVVIGIVVFAIIASGQPKRPRGRK